jgi:hypothetical protein
LSEDDGCAVVVWSLRVVEEGMKMFGSVGVVGERPAMAILRVLGLFVTLFLYF